MSDSNLYVTAFRYGATCHKLILNSGKILCCVLQPALFAYTSIKAEGCRSMIAVLSSLCSVSSECHELPTIWSECCCPPGG